MKAITNQADLPKFLVVNGEPERQPFNKHLLKPWKKGEIVKVHPEQTSAIQTPDKKFRKQFVKVVRKDVDGHWTLVYTAPWNYFELLNNKNTVK